MTSETSVQPSQDAGLTRQRLRVEAALCHQGVPVRVLAGKLWILLTEGFLPVVIRRMRRGGFRAELRLRLGTCEVPDDEFQQFIADVNVGRESPIVEVREDGTTDLFWVGECEETIDAAAVVRAVMELADASTAVVTELRDRFFVALPGEYAPLDAEEKS
jgi:hypothetical protein